MNESTTQQTTTILTEILENLLDILEILLNQSQTVKTKKQAIQFINQHNMPFIKQQLFDKFDLTESDLRFNPNLQTLWLYPTDDFLRLDPMTKLTLFCFHTTEPTDFQTKYPLIDVTKLPVLRQFQFINYYNLPTNLLNHHIDQLGLNNSQSVTLTNQTLCNLWIYDNTSLNLPTPLNNLTLLGIESTEPSNFTLKFPTFTFENLPKVTYMRYHNYHTIPPNILNHTTIKNLYLKNSKQIHLTNIYLNSIIIIDDTQVTFQQDTTHLTFISLETSEKQDYNPTTLQLEKLKT